MHTYGPQLEYSDRLHANKYRIPGESFCDAMVRVANALKDGDEHYQAFKEILQDQRFLPGGRVQSAMGAPKQVTALNCFVGGVIPDSFIARDNEYNSCIMDRVHEAAATMRPGGGLGNDFSTLRPSGAPISKIQSTSSGPVKFIPIFDAVGNATSSTGERRGAQMGVLRIDHPDIFLFIKAKHDNISLTRFNISVAITDAFMEHLQSGSPFPLIFNGKIYRYVDPEELWETLMQSTYHWAEPGCFFVDRVNYWNNLWYCEKIAATNPCIVGDTLVAVAGRGAIPIKQLVDEGKDVPVFAVNPANGETMVRWGRNPRLTGHKMPIVKVMLDDGSSIRVTPNHKFPLRDGRTVEAKDLRFGDSLFRFDSKTTNVDTWIGINNPKREQHLIGEAKYGCRFNFGTKKGQYHAHHMDGNHKNNDWDNIEIKLAEDHNRDHKMGDDNPMRFWWDSLDDEAKNKHREKMSASTSGEANGMWGRQHSDEVRTTIGEKSKKRHQDPDYALSHQQRTIEAMDEEVRAKIRTSREKMFITVRKHCLYCEKEFRFRAAPTNSKKIENKKFCSVRCSLIYRNKNTLKEPMPEAQRKAISAILKDRPHTAEHNAKVSDGLKKYVKTEEHKQHISESAKKRTDNWRNEKGQFVNHKVVTVIEDGFEDVYNITVDEFHNYAIVTSSGVTPRANYPVMSGIFCRNCGEIPLPPGGSCLLGSYNYTKYIKIDHVGKRYFDFLQFIHDIPIVTRAMDNILDRTIYPLEMQKQEAHNKRRMGIGGTGLANAIEAIGHPYGTIEFLRMEREMNETLTHYTYLASCDLALEKGSFPLFDQEKYLESAFIKTLHTEVKERIRHGGIRNSHLISYAPTGTISMTADNVSSSLEPVYQWRQKRPVELPGGTIQADLYDYAFRVWNVRGKRAANGEVTAKQHVDVLVTAQQFTDNAVSKTVNTNGSMPWSDFKNIYLDAYNRGAKGLTTFNKDGKRFGLFKNEIEPDDLPFPDSPVEIQGSYSLNDASNGESCTFDPATGKRTCE